MDDREPPQVRPEGSTLSQRSDRRGVGVRWRLIPPAKRGGRKRKVDIRAVLNGVLYVLSTGCQWRYLPNDVPPKSTVPGYLQRWDYDGTLTEIHHALYVTCREQAGRAASPIACVIDSQSVQSAEKGGPRSIRRATMPARKSRERSGTSLSIRWG